MSIAAGIRTIKSLLDPHPARPLAGAVAQFASAAERIKSTCRFELGDIDLLAKTFAQYDVVRGTPWDDLRLAHLVLPDWFRTGLDPLTDEYRAQKRRLWSQVAGVDRDYVPEIDEKEIPLVDVDAVRRPGFFMRRDQATVELAADHVIGTGMIMKYSGLKPGDSALEYGAGFGHAALTLGRLGVAVDTVDISSTFCAYVKQQADFYQVPVTPFEGRFGWNPRGTHKYQLIWFFESFHHCLDFATVVDQLENHLAPGGRVILVGEPILRVANHWLPYPWGLRLDAETVAQIRRFHWFELGFREDFLVGLFANAGYTAAARIECPAAAMGEGYVFQRRGASVEMSSTWPGDDAGWNAPESEGRWTRAQARLFLDTSQAYDTLEIEASNHHPFGQTVEIRYGAVTQLVRFRRGEHKVIVLPADRRAGAIHFGTKTFVPANDYGARITSEDARELGIFIHRLTYR